MIRSRALYLSCVFVLMVQFVGAQTPDTASIHGRVTDPSTTAVAGAKVDLHNVRTGLERHTQTDAAGEFTLIGLPASGNYSIDVTKQGFSDGRIDDITLAAETNAEVKIQLSVAGGVTRVTVEGAFGQARADTPQLGIALSGAEASEMPLLDRKITYLPLLNATNRPAINQGDVFMNEDLFTTNGAGRRQTWFEVDGSTGNDSWGRQTIFSNIPADAVQEMTVLINGFSAEYGGSTGSAVNIITKSGGNHFR